MDSIKMKYEEGRVYDLHSVGGCVSKFKCLKSYTDNSYGYTQYNAKLINIYSGWTFMAHGTRMYEDGSIEWDFSGDGVFAKMEV